MPSPFPGMDPWLEGPALFPGFHKRFVAAVSDALNEVLPPPYVSVIENRVVIEGDGPPGLREPDVGVFRPTGANGSQTPAGGGVLTAPSPAVRSVIVHAPADDRTEWFVEVRTTAGGERLVAAVELLSPSNKTTDRTAYRAKQRELLGRGVHLVEIDLLRAGPHATAVPLGPARQTAGPFDYHVCVTRADNRDDFEVFPILLPQQLPEVAVPLPSDVAPARVNLQAAMDRSYDTGLFARRVCYARPPDPPLTPDQAEWAAELLRAKGVTP